jgi:5-methylcytosine-specific restriction endonuclease McrA
MRNIVLRAEARAQGSTRYFTGEPCKHGHIAERKTSNMECVECARVSSYRHYLTNKVRIDAKNATYRAGNREQQHAKDAAKWAALTPEQRAQERERLRRWRAENRDHLKRYREENRGRIAQEEKRKRERHRERIAAAKAEWYRKDKDRIQANRARWKRQNKDRVNAANAKRRANQFTGGSFTAGDVAAVMKAQSHRCAYCRVSLHKVERHNDHIIPLTRGGLNTRQNLQVLCQPCNSKKHAKDPIDFARSMGRLL